MNVGNEIVLNAVMVGNLRAFAGLSLGAFLFHVSHFLNSHGTALWGTLGKLDMYIFLLHPPIIFLCKRYVQIEASDLGCILITAISLGFSIAVMLIREWTRNKGKAL